MSEIRKYINLIESAMRIDESFKTAKEKFITQNDNVQEINEYIEKFKELAKRNIIKGQDKDIGKWIKAGWNDFKEFVEQSESIKSKNQTMKEIKSNVIKIKKYDIVVVIPLSEESSRMYGKNTKWCTSSDCGGNRFNEYFHDMKKLMVYVTRGKVKVALEIDDFNTSYSYIKIWNENNNIIPPEKFENLIGVEVGDIIEMVLPYTTKILKSMKDIPESMFIDRLFTGQLSKSQHTLLLDISLDGYKKYFGEILRDSSMNSVAGKKAYYLLTTIFKNSTEHIVVPYLLQLLELNDDYYQLYNNK